MAKFAVIIPAAGAGERFGGKVKKPFALLNERPVFVRSLELFINRDDVCQTLLAVSPDDYDVVREKFAANIMVMGFELVKGGAERFLSVRAALEQVSDEATHVAIHDAVRPCVTTRWIDDVFAAAVKSGAAMLACPLTGSIKRVTDGHVAESVVRSGMYEAQTPQVFEKGLLRAAYAALAPDTKPTDDAEVVAKSGAKISVIETDRRNLKITVGSDLALAGTILKDLERQARPSGGPRNPFEEAQW